MPNNKNVIDWDALTPERRNEFCRSLVGKRAPNIRYTDTAEGTWFLMDKIQVDGWTIKIRMVGKKADVKADGPLHLLGFQCSKSTLVAEAIAVLFVLTKGFNVKCRRMTND